MKFAFIHYGLAERWSVFLPIRREDLLRVNIIAQSAFVRNAVFLVELRLQGIQALLRVVRGNYVRTRVNELVNGLAVQNLNHGLNSLVAHLVSHLGDRHRHLAGQDCFTSSAVTIEAEEDGVLVCVMVKT